MACEECNYRKDEFCLLFDDIILNMSDSCFMDTEKGGLKNGK